MIASYTIIMWSATHLRQNPASIDPTFPHEGAAGSTAPTPPQPAPTPKPPKVPKAKTVAQEAKIVLWWIEI